MTFLMFLTFLAQVAADGHAELQCDVKKALTCTDAPTKGWCSFLSDNLDNDNVISRWMPSPSWCTEQKAHGAVRPSDERLFYAALTDELRTLIEQRHPPGGTCSVFPMQLPLESGHHTIRVCFSAWSANDTRSAGAQEDCETKKRDGECVLLLRERERLFDIVEGKFTLHPDPVLGTGQVFLKVYNRTSSNVAVAAACPGTHAPTRIRNIHKYAATLLCDDGCHPLRVPQFKYAASDDQWCCAAHEWVEGVTFADFMSLVETRDDHGPLLDIRFDDIYMILRDVVLALADMHIRGLRHGDLRTSNVVVLGLEGNTFRPPHDGTVYVKLLHLDFMLDARDMSSYATFSTNCRRLYDNQRHFFVHPTKELFLTLVKTEFGPNYWGYSDMECFYLQFLLPIEKHLFGEATPAWVNKHLFGEAPPAWGNWSETLFFTYVRAVRADHNEGLAFGSHTKNVPCYVPVNPLLSLHNRFALVPHPLTFVKYHASVDTSNACPDVDLTFHSKYKVFSLTMTFSGTHNTTHGTAERVLSVTESVALEDWLKKEHKAMFSANAVDAADAARAEAEFARVKRRARADFVDSGGADSAARAAAEFGVTWMRCSDEYTCGHGWNKDALKANNICADGNVCHDSDCCSPTSGLGADCGNGLQCTHPNTCVLKSDPRTACGMHRVLSGLCTCVAPQPCSHHEVEDDCAHDASCVWVSSACTPKCVAENGKACVFPFAFHEEYHYGCTNIDEEDVNNFWCSTGTDENNEMEWDYCQQCALSSTLQEESMI